jgi:fermentation-respiration switch protein FrsA (DUF1100 family)
MSATAAPSVEAPTQPRRKRWKGVLLALFVVALLVSFVQSMLLSFYEVEYWFRPTPAEYGNWETDLPVEDANFTSADGTPLHGWFLAHDNPRAVILYCHGAAGNVTHSAEILRLLHDKLRCSVLIFDYRGYGKSGGQMDNEAGLFADARAARAWLCQRTGTPASDIVIIGRSMGSGVATELAARDGARGLVLEAAFTSVRAVTWQYFRWAIFRLPMQHPLDSLSKIANYRGPLLQCHGDSDSQVPLSMGQKLHAAANEPKQLYVMHGASHADNPPDEYYELFDQFLAQLPPVTASAVPTGSTTATTLRETSDSTSAGE